MTHAAPLSIRLAGGIGAHLLGMRALSLAHQRFPDRRIIVYSSCGNHPVPPRVVAMSPLVAEVITDTAAPEDAIDATGEDLFAKAATALRMPLFDILAARPVLHIPDWAAAEADRLLHRLPASSFVAVCFAGEEPETLHQFQPRILDAIGMALESSDAMALNFFTTHDPFAHRPDFVPCRDLPIELVAALLARCRYFIGGDNGLKHLAWALDIPRTFFVKERPHRFHILRWMPDVHRMLPFDCPDDRLRNHLCPRSIAASSPLLPVPSPPRSAPSA